MPEGNSRLGSASRYTLARLGMAIAPALLLCGAAGATVVGPSPDETYPVNPTSVYTLPATNVGGGSTNPLTSFDISFVDNVAGVYELADRSNASVDSMDLNTNTFSVISPSNTGCTLPTAGNPACAFAGLRTDPNAGTINDISGPNGVTIVNHNEIWAGDAPTLSGPVPLSTACQGGDLNACKTAYLSVDNCDSSVKVINLRSQQVTDVINTGGCFRADEMAFDEVDQILVVANDAEQDIGNPNFITLISANPGHAILAKIVFDGTNGTPNATGGIEQSQYSPSTGLFYVAVPSDRGPSPTPRRPAPWRW